MAFSDRSRLALLGLPPIDNLGDFSDQIRLSKGTIYRLAKFADRNYRVFGIPKKRGGCRTIAQPSRKLKAVQGWILRRLLDHMSVSPACKGFQKGDSIRDNALAHAQANAVLSLDIEDFFPSVKANKVYALFRKAGYNTTAAGLFTSLCTFNGSLPQGAPSSPKLANLVCTRMDARISGFTGKRGIIYTRYADDLTFSAYRMDPLVRAYHVIRQIVREEGFALNEAKTRYAGPARQRRVTGLIIGTNGVGIGRTQMRTLRTRIHTLTKSSLPDTDGTTVSNIRGWLAYVRSVDPRRSAILENYVGTLERKFPDTAIIAIRVRSISV